MIKAGSEVTVKMYVTGKELYSVRKGIVTDILINACTDGLEMVYVDFLDWDVKNGWYNLNEVEEIVAAGLFSPASPPVVSVPLIDADRYDESRVKDGPEVEITKAYARRYLSRETTVIVLSAIRASRQRKMFDPIKSKMIGERSETPGFLFAGRH